MGYASQRRLFRVFFQGRNYFFQHKQLAKAFGQERGLMGVVVHRGPDHWRGESNGTSKKTRSSKRGW